MELKEKLRQILKERYGIENDAEIIKEARALQGIAEERPQSRTIAFWDRWKNAGAIDVTDATTKYITG